MSSSLSLLSLNCSLMLSVSNLRCEKIFSTYTICDTSQQSLMRSLFLLVLLLPRCSSSTTSTTILSIFPSSRSASLICPRLHSKPFQTPFLQQIFYQIVNALLLPKGKFTPHAFIPVQVVAARHAVKLGRFRMI